MSTQLVMLNNQLQAGASQSPYTLEYTHHQKMPRYQQHWSIIALPKVAKDYLALLGYYWAYEFLKKSLDQVDNTLHIPVEQADSHTQARWPGIREWHGQGEGRGNSTRSGGRLPESGKEVKKEQPGRISFPWKDQWYHVPSGGLNQKWTGYISFLDWQQSPLR